MIEVKNLTKKYGDHIAVNNISFTVERERIYGLLGPNGAGKSTTMNIITGCLAASDGSVTVGGYDIFEEPKKAKSLIGYLPEQPPVYGDMTPFEYLTFVASAKKMRGEAREQEVREVMEMTSLLDVKDRLIRNLSKGYKQRVGIAQAMIGDPEIIILDEPTVGLDPKQILEIRELIKMLGETKTVIISSHILAEISAVCDNIMIISHGNLVANDTIENLEAIADRSSKLRLGVRGGDERVEGAIRAVLGVISCTAEAGENGIVNYSIEVDKEKDVRDEIFFAMSALKAPIVSMEYDQRTLEDIFLALTADDIVPDENGLLPTVEEILDGSYKKEEDSHFSENDETDEQEENINDDENDDGDGYTPLFGGN